jgi:hypothetical protein
MEQPSAPTWRFQDHFELGTLDLDTSVKVAKEISWLLKTLYPDKFTTEEETSKLPKETASTYVPTYPALHALMTPSHTTTVVNNYGPNYSVIHPVKSIYPDWSNSKTSSSTINQSTKEEKKDTTVAKKQAGLTNEQIIATSAIAATALLVAAWKMPSDYDVYKSYKLINDEYEKWVQAVLNKKISVASPESERSNSYCNMMYIWNLVKVEVWKKIYEPARNKLGGGIGITGAAIALVLGSVAGIVGGIAITGAAVASELWRRNSRVEFDEKIKSVVTEADRFLTLYKN